MTFRTETAQKHRYFGSLKVNERREKTGTMVKQMVWHCPPKAEVTRSNRVGCAILFNGLVDFLRKVIGFLHSYPHKNPQNQAAKPPTCPRCGKPLQAALDGGSGYEPCDCQEAGDEKIF